MKTQEIIEKRIKVLEKDKQFYINTLLESPLPISKKNQIYLDHEIELVETIISTLKWVLNNG